MAQDLEGKVEEAEVEEEILDDEYDGIDEEDLLEAGYKAHKFSLFDSPIEIGTIIFMAAYVIYSFVAFAIANPGGTEIINIFDFLFELVVKMIPGVILLVACEIHEKVELVEYNLSLNSEYMARYQMDLLEKLSKKDK